ncbi:MAG: hypothetical protein Q7I97_08325 [Thermovirgaceae bacterium]|nr:hypothetical protein [Thermovirgaceae bacterium]
MSIASGSVGMKGAGKYGIDLSVGSAIAAPGGENFDVDRLIQEADEDMYRHKRSKPGQALPREV